MGSSMGVASILIALPEMPKLAGVTRGESDGRPNRIRVHIYRLYKFGERWKIFGKTLELFSRDSVSHH